MRILRIKRTKQGHRSRPCKEPEQRGEGHPFIPERSKENEQLCRKSESHGVSWGYDGVMSSGPSHFQRHVAFKRCFLESISKVPVPHCPTGISTPRTPLSLVPLSPVWLQCGFSPSTMCGSCPCCTLKIIFVLVAGPPVHGKQHRTGNKVLRTNNYLTTQVCLLESQGL